jgi:hypothetical protein
MLPLLSLASSYAGSKDRVVGLQLLELLCEHVLVIQPIDCGSDLRIRFRAPGRRSELVYPTVVGIRAHQLLSLVLEISGRYVGQRFYHRALCVKSLVWLPEILFITQLAYLNELIVPEVARSTLGGGHE